MIITIEKVQELKFDCDAERQRILNTFNNNDPRQSTLTEVVNQFERGDLEACAVIMRKFTPDDWENLHWVITDVMVRYLRETDENSKGPTSYRFTHCKL